MAQFSIPMAISWYIDSLFYSNGPVSSIANLPVGSHYIMAVSSNTSCPASAVQTISVFPNPSLELGNDTATCDMPILLNVSSDFMSYLWNTGDTTQSIIADTTFSYTVMVMDTNGCSASDTINVIIHPLPAVMLTAFNTDTLCITSGNHIINNGNPPGGSYSGSSVTGNVFDPLAAGTGWHYITYSYTDSLGCSNIAIDSIFVDVCFGLDEKSKGNTLLLQPNPTIDELTLMFKHDLGETAEITIFDLMGRQLEQHQMTTNKLKLDITTLPQGLYLIKVQTDESTTSRRFVKQ